jgi:outer membrane lipoprotein SlyB
MLRITGSAAANPDLLCASTQSQVQFPSVETCRYTPYQFKLDCSAISIFNEPIYIAVYWRSIMEHSCIILMSLTFATALTGCAYPGSYPAQPQPVAYPYQTYPSSPHQYTSYGVVDSIQRVDNQGAVPQIGAGTVIGGVVGGLLGNRIGGGNGKKIAIATGAVGGAIIGNQIGQQNRTALPMYQIGVRMENGVFQTYTQDSIAGLGIGTQVRIDNGRVYRY